VTAVAILGTPAWPYGRTLYTEPYLLACAVGAYAAAFRKRWFVVAGCAIALGVSMKPPVALFAVPLAVVALAKGRILSAVSVTLPSCISVFALAALNRHMHGSWSRSALQWVSGDFVEGATGLLFSWSHGLLPFAPVALVAIACWPTFLRWRPFDAWQLAGGFALYFGVISAWVEWDGRDCYGPRMIVPAIPIFCVSLAAAPRCRWWSFLPARLAALGLCLLSLAINAVGAIGGGQFWGRNPLDAIVPFFVSGWRQFS
jgi:hypothetical protein